MKKIIILALTLLSLLFITEPIIARDIPCSSVPGSGPNCATCEFWQSEQHYGCYGLNWGVIQCLAGPPNFEEVFYDPDTPDRPLSYPGDCYHYDVEIGPQCINIYCVPGCNGSNGDTTDGNNFWDSDWTCG